MKNRSVLLKSLVGLTVFVLACIMISGCAPGPNKLVDTPDKSGRVAGFWHGLWHGFTVLFTFIISLFTDKVRIYDVHNSGSWYNFGYVIGVLFFFGGGSGEAGRRARCRSKKSDTGANDANQPADDK
jgi:hypothetical protein